MNPVRAAAIRNAIEIAERRRAPRAHHYRELKMMVLEDLRDPPRDDFWPLPIVFTALCIGLVGAVLAIGVSA